MMPVLKYMQRFLLVSAVVVTASVNLAQAAPIFADKDSSLKKVALKELVVDVSGKLNYDERGAASNVIADFYVGAGALITSLEWNVNVTTHDGSYLSEMQFTFSDTLGNGVTFTPGYGDGFDGTVDYAGFQNLNDIGQMFKVGTDGILRLEFHDSYKDLAFDEPEGVWNFGTLTFGVAQVPEPPTYALMLGSLLLLSAAARPRRGK